MSYNCHAEYLGDGRLRIKASELDRLREEFKNTTEIPGGNFLEDSECFAPACTAPDEMVITKLHWYGEGSGRAFDTLKEKLLPATMGYADIGFALLLGSAAKLHFYSDGCTFLAVH